VKQRALELVPLDAPDAWNHALMDLGATICQARVAACDRCPMQALCDSAGQVDPQAERAMRGKPGGGAGSRPQRFEDTQRYVRGRIVAALVEQGALERDALLDALPDGIEPTRVASALTSLVADGLVDQGPAGLLSLPS
jgi:A/G-specific adenine glycosylase